MRWIFFECMYLKRFVEIFVEFVKNNMNFVGNFVKIGEVKSECKKLLKDQKWWKMMDFRKN